MPYEAATALSKASGIKLPEKLKVMPDHWHIRSAAAKGGSVRCAKYGNPGTPEGRRRGGLASQQRFREDPAHARSVGVIIRKDIRLPEASELLAEFIGILLGDGGITSHQVRITYGRASDKAHALFVRRTVKNLFGIDPVLISRKCSRADDIVISSRNLVDFLAAKGLKQGSKIRNAVDIPCWILKKDSHKKACLRGLIDTDGSFYEYRHRVNGRHYNSFAMCFTSYSVPMVHSVYRILNSLGFGPVKYSRKVYLNKFMDIKRYFDIIGSHNPKHEIKFKRFLAKMKLSES